MKKTKLGIGDILGNIGGRNIAVAAVAMLLALAFVAGGGMLLYSYAKEAITRQGEAAATQSAKEVDTYLNMNANAITLAGYNVDRMITSETPHSRILAYLTEETMHIITTIDKDNNGVYGWVDGEYMDVVWTPDADYVPKERPWYTEAIANESDVTYVKPYLDAQTGKVMMTISNRLSDGESVLALDISLDKLQEVTEAVARDVDGSIGMILDDDGDVVAHSDINERGKSYSAEENTLGSKIVGSLTGGSGYEFEIKHENASYIVYVVKLDAGWNSVSVINADIVFRPLRIIISLSVAAAILLVIVITAVLIRISRKNLLAQNLNLQLASVADIYVSMHDIDLVHDSYRTISCRDEVKNFMGDDNLHAQDALYSVMDKITDEMSKQLIMRFIDLSTLPERLAEVNTVIEEFLNNKNLWCRARFIAAERSKEGELIRVLWVIESIDEEKRRRDRLKYLSETDLMTGINNRGSGEHKVTKLMNQGVGGMFIVLDADRFKLVNDSFGHEVGDKVLIAIAAAMIKSFRVDDIVMRLGGDEFAAYAPGVYDEATGRAIIRRLFDNLTAVSVPELGEHRVNVSIGAAFFADDDKLTFSELYKLADSGTYESKKIMGNAVSFVRPDK